MSEDISDQAMPNTVSEQDQLRVALFRLEQAQVIAQIHKTKLDLALKELELANKQLAIYKAFVDRLYSRAGEGTAEAVVEEQDGA